MIFSEFQAFRSIVFNLVDNSFAPRFGYKVKFSPGGVSLDRDGCTGWARRQPGGRPEMPWSGGKTFSIPATSRDRLVVGGGEDLELLSREPGVTAAGLSRWRHQCLTEGRGVLKKRPEAGWA